MNEIQTYDSDSFVRVSVHLSTLELADDLYVFRRVDFAHVVTTHVGSPLYPADKQNSDVRVEGIIDKKNLLLLKAGKPYRTSPMVIYSQELIENIRRYGFHLPFDKHRRPAHVADGHKQIRTDVFEALAVEKVPLDTLVRPDHASFVLYSYDGSALPVGMKFDYMNGQINETNYDLKKASAHLATRDDVVLYASDDADRIATTVDDAIIAIPYYNSEKGRTQQIVFRWAPSKDEYQKMVTVIGMKKIGLKNLFYEEAMKQDLLGLRAAGVILKNYY